MCLSFVEPTTGVAHAHTAPILHFSRHTFATFLQLHRCIAIGHQEGSAALMEHARSKGRCSGKLVKPSGRPSGRPFGRPPPQQPRAPLPCAWATLPCGLGVDPTQSGPGQVADFLPNARLAGLDNLQPENSSSDAHTRLTLSTLPSHCPHPPHIEGIDAGGPISPRTQQRWGRI